MRTAFGSTWVGALWTVASGCVPEGATPEAWVPVPSTAVPTTEPVATAFPSEVEPGVLRVTYKKITEERELATLPCTRG